MARAADGSRALKLDRVNNIRAMVTGARVKNVPSCVTLAGTFFPAGAKRERDEENDRAGEDLFKMNATR